jgi:putative addiction module component (TIGR02574 family)
MTKEELKTELQQLIDQLDDEKMLEAVYTILSSQSPIKELTDEQKAELDKRLEQHEAGESESYSWEEVKKRVRSSS